MKQIKQMTRPTIQIVMHGVKHCSGTCPFCSEAANTAMLRGKKDIDTINDIIYDDIKFDFDALEKAIKEHPNWKDNTRISIWGGDPLTSFDGFKDIVDFINYIKEDKKHIQFSCSTNGLALEKDDIAQWVYDNHILFQLSHDGLGQKYRTGNKDPLKFDNIKQLIKTGNCHSIYTILYSLNYKPLDNIIYFNDYDILPPYRRINVVRESTGPWNLRGEAADTYISQLRHIYDNIDDSIFDGWRYSLLREIKMQYRHKATPCSEFAKGNTEYSGIIDTLGKQTQCHLLDSTQTVSNPMMNKPECCKNCKYNTTWRCDMCGIDTLPDVCDFNFKYNSLLDELRAKPEFQERIKNIRGYLK